MSWQTTRSHANPECREFGDPFDPDVHWVVPDAFQNVLRASHPSDTNIKHIVEMPEVDSKFLPCSIFLAPQKVFSVIFRVTDVYLRYSSCF